MDNIKPVKDPSIGSNSKHFKKGTILQRAGEVNSNAYYVLNGLLKSYTIDSKGKEHVFLFAPEDWYISDIESQEFNKPTALFIECLEDSEVIIFDRQNFIVNDLTSEQLEIKKNQLFRRIAVLQRRMILMMSATAQERYENFLETYPELPNRVSQRLIASYLGITPEALSKIRGLMARSKK